PRPGPDLPVPPGDRQHLQGDSRMTLVVEPRTEPLPGAGAEILARAQALAPRLRERAVEIEQARRLPADVVDMLRDTGVFRMAFSRDWGGPELNSIEQ